LLKNGNLKRHFDQYPVPFSHRQSGISSLQEQLGNVAFWQAGNACRGGWLRGMNGLIREFFPKKTRFDSITKNDIALAMHRLNHRPRKCLGFRTPHEVFMEQLHFRLEAVALQS